jgi:hypothetical protein
MKIIATQNNKKIKVDVRDKKCKNKSCLIISKCNKDYYYCRIREIHGCPDSKPKVQV